MEGLDQYQSSVVKKIDKFALIDKDFVDFFDFLNNYFLNFFYQLPIELWVRSSNF